MKTIHKQVLPWKAAEEVTIQIPKKSLHLDIQLQEGEGGVPEVTVWYLCDPEAETEELIFRIVGTGWELPDDFANRHYWLKSLQHDGYVWHVFLKKPVERIKIG